MPALRYPGTHPARTNDMYDEMQELRLAISQRSVSRALGETRTGGPQAAMSSDALVRGAKSSRLKRGASCESESLPTCVFGPDMSFYRPA